jgi:hypothetical protein
MCALYPCFSPIVADVAQERPPDDETVLASLARDIARQQTLLVDLRARERAVSKRITLYPLAAWLVYLGVWYFGFVSGGSAGRVKPRAVRVLPVFMGPIVCVFSMLFAVSVRVDGLTDGFVGHRILFIRRIVQIWYARKGEAESASSVSAKLARVSGGTLARRCFVDGETSSISSPVHGSAAPPFAPLVSP